MVVESMLVFEGNITLDVLKHVVDSVLPSAGIKGPMPWAQRAEEHQTIANTIHKNLSHNAHYG